MKRLHFSRDLGLHALSTSPSCERHLRQYRAQKVTLRWGTTALRLLALWPITTTHPRFRHGKRLLQPRRKSSTATMAFLQRRRCNALRGPVYHSQPRLVRQAVARPCRMPGRCTGSGRLRVARCSRASRMLSSRSRQSRGPLLSPSRQVPRLQPPRRGKNSSSLRLRLWATTRHDRRLWHIKGLVCPLAQEKMLRSSLM